MSSKSMTSVSVNQLKAVKIHYIERDYKSFSDFINKLISAHIEAHGSDYVQLQYNA